MTHASLFSGIGGFDLAAQWAGWINRFNCEIDPFCQQVLKHHFPDATQYTDIRATDFTLWNGQIDVLSGGFPCQPFSVAGKRLGTEDERHLWPEMLRAIREVSPRWVVGENVRGIVNWSGGLVFEQVCADLEAEGYEVQPFVLPACGVGAPHRRDRVWFVAHDNSDRQWKRSDQQEPIRWSGGTTNISTLRKDWSAANSDSTRFQAQRTEQPTTRTSGFFSQTIAHAQSAGLQARASGSREKQSRRRDERMGAPADWEHFPTQSPVCSRNDGLPDQLDGITFPKWRAESIKAYGNAVVPQVALQIFETINQIEL